MNQDKVTTFGPGQGFRLDRKIIFVEYESMTGELVKCRFDLSQKTEMIYNDHRILSFDDLTYLYSTDEELFIKKVLYYEQECHMVIGDKLLIPTKIYFENAGYQLTYKGVVYTNPTSENGREGTMRRTPLCEKREYFQAEAGDVVLYGGKYFVWTGILNGWKEISSNGYFDTDMAMTREEMWYCRNDVAVTEKLFKEEKIMRFNACKPTIKNVIFNDPATIVMWSDGTKTVVKCGKNDIFDPEKGVAMCCMKKLLGTNKTGSNYLDKVEKYFDKYDEDYIEECKPVGEILSSILKSDKKQTDVPPEESIEREFEAVTSNDWKVSDNNE